MQEPMQATIERITGKKLAGKRVRMSFADYRVGELWKHFMPARHEIGNRLSEDLISLAVYPPAFFSAFQPNAIFEKWAGVEVADFSQIPAGMETLEVPGGLYAVFHYKGLSGDPTPFRYIHESWMPRSGYEPDHRPHFEILDKNFRNHDPDSEEQIWIPVKEMG